MAITKIHIIKSSAIVLITTIFTSFFYLHESFSKPIRALTSFFATPTSIASGLSYYLKLGIPVYQYSLVIIAVNFITSFFIIFMAGKISNWIKF